ncbi:lymphoid enhancer-binding factor 1-like isoform X2 [Cynoglossus semilaevis]|uniref:lymphoid enhancer-binding factor 1-like isoform X2 n=1 Tax=Cynoglossus semilaevis TaxID=244447 RepID=UPI000496A159|nr:lymphoid enhancer-binding factor 1-like isoform X2 [Cynoglossus semilaevis]
MSEYSHTMYYNMFSSIIDRMDPEELLETSHAIYREVYGEMRPPPVVDLTNDSDWNVVMVPGPFRSDQNFRERTTAMGTPLINDQEQLPCAMDSHIRPQDLPCMTVPQDLEEEKTSGIVVESCQASDQTPVQPSSPRPRRILRKRPLDVGSDVKPATDPITPAETKRFRGAQDERQPGAKKPPNAFMLYAKEERAKVAAELGSSHAALVNKALSQKWRSLSTKKRAKYVREAEKLKKIHVKN